MTNLDHPAEADVEDALATLMAECQEARARGEDVTPLLDGLAGFSPEARSDFIERLECIQFLEESMAAKPISLALPCPFGKFHLLKLLGHGGFGIVWLAEDPALGRKVALKVPRLHRLLSPDAAERFTREARAAATLEHPHLVPVFEIGEVDGLTYLASAYCEGPSLAEWLRGQNTPVSVRAAAQLIEVLAGAAAYMHERGILHRDLKPSNVLLFPKGVRQEFQSALLSEFEPKITDFGLARRQEAMGDLTRTGVILGTPAYMAPEHAWGQAKHVGPAADIYSLGTILYELVTGRPPFQAGNDLETLRQAKELEPIPPRCLRPATPRDLETICLKCLEKEPCKRYGGMTQLADDLTRFLEGRPTLARPNRWVMRGVKWARRKPVAAALVGMASFCLFGLVVIPAWLTVRDNEYDQALKKAQENAGLLTIRAEEQQWQKDNLSYATEMRQTWEFHQKGEVDMMHEVLQRHWPKPGRKDIRGFEWHYLRRLARADTPLRGHRTRIMALAYSQNGRLCAAGALDGTIKLWEVESGQLMMTLAGHRTAVERLRFAEKDTRLISAGWGTDPQNGGLIGDLRVWDLSTGKTVLECGPYRHDGKIGMGFGIAIAREASYAIVIRAGKDGGLAGINLKTGEEKVLDCSDWSEDQIVTADVSPGADLIAVAEQNIRVYLVDPNAPKRPELIRLVGRGGISVIRFSPDGKLLGIGTEGPSGVFSMDVWDVRSRTRRQALPVKNIPESCVFDSSNNWFAAIDLSHKQSRGFYLWDLKQTQGSLIDSKSSGKITNAAFSPSSHELAVGKLDGSVRLRPIKAAGAEISLPGPAPGGEAWCLAFTPDGKTLAAGYDHEAAFDSETLKLWDTRTRQSKNLTGHHGTVMAAAVSLDGKVLATASYDKTVRLWDMTSGECRTLPDHTLPVRALAFSPDGEVLVSGGSDQSIKMWKVADGSRVKSWQGHDNNVRALAFAPTGETFFSAGNDSLIRIWKASDQSLVRTIQEEGKIQGLACSPSGLMLASANEKNNVRLWDVPTGLPVNTLRGHTGKVRTVAFSPDGKTLASGGEDNTVRLWHVTTGQDLLVFQVEHAVNGLAFDRQGKTLAAAIHDGTVKVWPTE